MFELTITRRNVTEGTIAFYEKLEAENMVELFARLLVIVARIQQQIAAEMKAMGIDDDVPF